MVKIPGTAVARILGSIRQIRKTKRAFLCGDGWSRKKTTSSCRHIHDRNSRLNFWINTESNLFLLPADRKHKAQPNNGILYVANDTSIYTPSEKQISLKSSPGILMELLCRRRPLSNYWGTFSGTLPPGSNPSRFPAQRTPPLA